MSDNPEVIDRSAVFRQRRLLLSFSFALAAIHILDVQLSGNVTAQGLVLTFKHPQILVYVLWLAWPWSLWRYWQYEKVYRDTALEVARMAIATRMTEEAITKGIQERVRVGAYKQRVNPTATIIAKIPIGETFTPTLYSQDTWVFPNASLYVVDERGGEQGPVDGGANYSLDSQEVAAIKRSMVRELTRRHPSFADFKAPYWLAMTAPFGGVWAIVRHLCWSCMT